MAATNPTPVPVRVPRGQIEAVERASQRVGSWPQWKRSAISYRTASANRVMRRPAADLLGDHGGEAMVERTQCACQRLDAISSELIRLRALLAQRQKEVAAMQAGGDIVPLAQLERAAIESAMRTHGVSLVPKLLGIGKTTLYRRLKEYGWDLRTLRLDELKRSV